MICSTLMGAALLCAAPAQDPAPQSAGEAAGVVLHDVCLGLFDGRPVAPARLGEAVRARGLDGAAPDWRIYNGADGAVSVAWDGANRACQVRITGPAGAGADLLEQMTAIGWTESQRNLSTGPDTAADVWSGRPQGVDAPLLVVANRWTSDAEPEDGQRIVLVMMRAQ